VRPHVEDGAVPADPLLGEPDEPPLPRPPAYPPPDRVELDLEGPLEAWVLRGLVRADANLAKKEPDPVGDPEVLCERYELPELVR